MIGWTWASLDDVNALFNHYIGRDELGPGPDFYGDDFDSEWATAFFNDGWRGMALGESEFVRDDASGWVRTLADESSAYLPGIADDVNGPGISGDIVSTLSSDSIDEQKSGAWFYRTP